MVNTVDQYGAPTYGPIGRPVAGLIFHTPENVDHTLAQAIAVARWQGTASNTSGGSYHGILGWDSKRGNMDNPDAWVMVRTVPWDTASGGVTTRRDSIWAPSRYPWIQKLVHPAAYGDPNKYFHQIALSGKAAWYNTNGYPKGAVIALAQWVKILEKAYSYDAVLTLHRMWQTNRSDPGPIDLADKVLAAYEALSAPAPTPTPTPTPTPAPAPSPLEVANKRIATKNAKINSALAVLKDALDD